MITDILSIPNLNTYIKGLELKTAWELKQQSGNTDAKGLSLEEWLDASQTQHSTTESPLEHGDEKLREIHAKIDAGGRLTPEERDYLKNKDPNAYQELVEQEQAQKAYEQALRRCKTKEEVSRLQMNHINKSMTVLRSVEHNSHIPLQEKLKIAMREKRLLDDVAESTRAFIRRGELAKLPTEAEAAEVRQAQSEQQSSASGSQSPPESSLDPALDQAHNSPDIPAEHTPTTGPRQEDTPVDLATEKKVQRAQAKRAYAASAEGPEIPVSPSRPVLNRKI